jgi:hypothetical protein
LRPLKERGRPRPPANASRKNRAERTLRFASALRDLGVILARQSLGGDAWRFKSLPCEPPRIPAAPEMPPPKRLLHLVSCVLLS